MGLEATCTYIDSLVITNPVGASDLPLTTDDHLKLIKGALKRTFPGLAGAMVATPAQLDAIDTAVRRNQNITVSATWSYAARPQYSRNSAAYPIGGHVGAAVDRSATLVSPSLGWSTSLSATEYRLYLPSGLTAIGPSYTWPRLSATVTPNGPGLRARSVVSTFGSRPMIVWRLYPGQSTTATLGAASVLINFW